MESAFIRAACHLYYSTVYFSTPHKIMRKIPFFYDTPDFYE